MKIVVNNDKPIYTFSCWNCGTAFKSDEYIKEYTNKDGSKLDICYWIIEKCPYCKKIVKRLEAD